MFRRKHFSIEERVMSFTNKTQKVLLAGVASVLWQLIPTTALASTNEDVCWLYTATGDEDPNDKPVINVYEKIPSNGAITYLGRSGSELAFCVIDKHGQANYVPLHETKSNGRRGNVIKSFGGNDGAELQASLVMCGNKYRNVLIGVGGMSADYGWQFCGGSANDPYMMPVVVPDDVDIWVYTMGGDDDVKGIAEKSSHAPESTITTHINTGSGNDWVDVGYGRESTSVYGNITATARVFAGTGDDVVLSNDPSYPYSQADLCYGGDGSDIVECTAGYCSGDSGYDKCNCAEYSSTLMEGDACEVTR
jgi:hypothetical protein